MKLKIFQSNKIPGICQDSIKALLYPLKIEHELQALPETMKEQI